MGWECDSWLLRVIPRVGIAITRRQGRTWHGADCIWNCLSHLSVPGLRFCQPNPATVWYIQTCVTQYKRLSPQPLAMPSQTASCGFDRDLPCF